MVLHTLMIHRPINTKLECLALIAVIVYRPHTGIQVAEFGGSLVCHLLLCA